MVEWPATLPFHDTRRKSKMFLKSPREMGSVFVTR